MAGVEGQRAASLKRGSKAIRDISTRGNPTSLSALQRTAMILFTLFSFPFRKVEVFLFNWYYIRIVARSLVSKSYSPSTIPPRPVHLARMNLCPTIVARLLDISVLLSRLLHEHAHVRRHQRHNCPKLALHLPPSTTGHNSRDMPTERYPGMAAFFFALSLSPSQF